MGNVGQAGEGSKMNNRVCGWYGRPPACFSSKTFSRVGSQQICGFAARCSDPSSHTPSAYRCSCWLFHCKHIRSHQSLMKIVLPHIEWLCRLYSLIIELDDLIAVLLQVVQMFNFIFVTFYGLSISFLQVHILHSKQLLFVIKNLEDLEEEPTALAAIKVSGSLWR